jgi:hypothetical protein
MFKDLLKRPVSGILLGAGVVLLAPIVLPAVARAARPLAKAALHGYFSLADGLKSLVGKEEKKLSSGGGHPVATEVEQAAELVGKEVLTEELTEAVVEGVATVLEVV